MPALIFLSLLVTLSFNVTGSPDSVIVICPGQNNGPTQKVYFFGMSHEPFTLTDTVSGIARRSGDKIYIKANDGRNIFAAWALEYFPRKDSMSCR